MADKTFVLKSTEILDGVKCRPGEQVTLPAEHPVTVKHLGQAEAAPNSPAAGQRGKTEKEK